MGATLSPVQPAMAAAVTSARATAPVATAAALEQLIASPVIDSIAAAMTSALLIRAHLLLAPNSSPTQSDANGERVLPLLH